jgi:hypothetical protein
MPPESSRGDLTASRPPNERPNLTDVTTRAVNHIHLGKHSTTREDLDGPDLKTWERLHAPFKSISSAELELNIGKFRELGWKARTRPDNIKQSYLLGVMDGLMDSAARAIYPMRSLHSAPKLIELLAKAEASVILTANGLSSFDRSPKDLPYCLGRLMAIAHASGETIEAIPLTVPPVPQHLK